MLGILNEAILHTTASYDYQPRTPDMMNSWLESKAKGNYPVMGIEDSSGELMGFASYGPFRPWPAYKYTVEHSVYVDERFRRQGVGQTLMRELIQRAKGQDYHVMIAGIDAANKASMALHECLGFQHCGTLSQVGFKFSRWLDLAFYQLILTTPANPVDG